MSTSAATPAAEQPAATASPAGTGHGWRAVSIVLVGAFMALLDGNARQLTPQAWLTMGLAAAE